MMIASKRKCVLKCLFISLSMSLCYFVFDPSILFQSNNSLMMEKGMTLTHDNPEKYRGPTVRGWPPSKNRSIQLYIKETNSFSIIPSKNKLVNKELIVIVQSRPNAFEARQANRDTWIKTGNSRISVIFLVGSDSIFSKDVQKKIEHECKEYSDIILVDDLVEHYDNLTLKTLYTLKFFIEADNFFTTIPNYLMKVDDDTFVNLPKVYQLLTEDTLYKNLKHLLLGKCYCDNQPVVKVDFIKRILQSKYVGQWQVPTYMYNGDKYPSFLSGSGYVLSRAVADCLYRESLKIPYFHLEDVHVTGFAAEACGIKRISNQGFDPFFGQKSLWNFFGLLPKTFDPDKDLLAHYVNTDIKREIFKMFQS